MRITHEERREDFELRNLANERNTVKSKREWVLCRGQLRHVFEHPKRELVNM